MKYFIVDSNPINSLDDFVSRLSAFVEETFNERGGIGPPDGFFLYDEPGKGLGVRMNSNSTKALDKFLERKRISRWAYAVMMPLLGIIREKDDEQAWVHLVIMEDNRVIAHARRDVIQHGKPSLGELKYKPIPSVH